MLTTNTTSLRLERSRLGQLTRSSSRRADIDDPVSGLAAGGLNESELEGMIVRAVRSAMAQPVSSQPTPPLAAAQPPGDITIVLELDRQQFARAVYRANREEARRVGVKLSEGGNG